jgi:tRNA (guanine-N7-)-methyltransferase
MATPAPQNVAAAATESSMTSEMTTEDDSRKRTRDISEEDPHQEEQAQQEPTPITAEGDMPQKKFYRSRAHCNPLSHNDTFDYPLNPSHMDWTESHYPQLATGVVPDVLDIGCGFGGLTLALATLLPNNIILGMEIRSKVTEYVRLRIVASRKEHPGSYQNASVLRTNSMKYLPNYFPQHSTTKLFFCFPDPHFKRKNHGRRIISERLLSEYAYILKPGGHLYCITDVKELHEWHLQKCDKHPLFRRLDETEMEADPCVEAMNHETEEGKKVERAGTAKYYAVYERIHGASKVTAETIFL